jgi:ornithine carbamoyltransferase
VATPLTAQALWKPSATDLRTDLDLSLEDLRHVLSLAAEVKRNPSRYAHALAGQYLSLLFEKPSLRTRMTFELAIKQLGGDCVTQVGPIAEREPVKDVARNLDRWTNAIVARTFSQQTVDDLAHWSSVPVINALSDWYHPCQILADMQTLEEQFGGLEGLKLAFVGDGNNVAHSLLVTGARLGIHVAVAAPAGYEPKAEVVRLAEELATDSKIVITNDPNEAVAGAHAVYTDVWASMGQESEAEERRKLFTAYQVNEELFTQARPDAVFMHCLPAKRGEETVDAILESPQSVVFDQAENRLHAQKALLLALLG